MSIKFKVEHLDRDHNRVLEVWLSGAAVPVQVMPGEAMEFVVYHMGSVRVEYGPTVEEVEHGMAGNRQRRDEEDGA